MHEDSPEGSQKLRPPWCCWRTDATRAARAGNGVGPTLVIWRWHLLNNLLGCFTELHFQPA